MGKKLSQKELVKQLENKYKEHLTVAGITYWRNRLYSDDKRSKQYTTYNCSVINSHSNLNYSIYEHDLKS